MRTTARTTLPQRAEDPVGVEAGDGVDGAPELGVERAPRRRRRRAARAGSSRWWNSATSRRTASGFAAQRVGQVRVGEPHPGLAQVLAERADDHDLARREPGAQHEPVQAVVLDRARPHAEEDVGDAGLHVGIAERITGRGDRTPNE